MSEIKQEIKDLSKLFKDRIQIGDNGVASIKEGTYVEMLPEGVTEEHVQKLQAFNSQVVAAGSLALGELGIPYMKKHKDVGVVELTIPTVGKDSIDIRIKRDATVTTPGTGEKNTVHGQLSAGMTTYSTRPRGELAKVKEHLAALAMKSLG